MNHGWSRRGRTVAVAMARRAVKCPHSREQARRTSESDTVDRSRRLDDGTPVREGADRRREGRRASAGRDRCPYGTDGPTDSFSRSRVLATRKRVNGRARSGVPPPLALTVASLRLPYPRLGERINTSLVSHDIRDIYSPPCTLAAITSEFALFLSLSLSFSPSLSLFREMLPRIMHRVIQSRDRSYAPRSKRHRINASKVTFSCHDDERESSKLLEIYRNQLDKYLEKSFSCECVNDVMNHVSASCSIATCIKRLLVFRINYKFFSLHMINIFF